MRALLLLPLLAATVAGCGKLTCGTGTTEVDGECVGEAVDALMCGPGTVRVGDACEVEEPPILCGEGTILRGTECIAVDASWAWLPVPAGTDAEVSQGHHGNFSHNGSSIHAVDLRMPEGSEVVAARGGVVLQLREDSNTGCGEPECSDQANYLVIDHGDGTLGRYWHLQQGGVLVDFGDVVEPGQSIARSGNTGWSTGPHLHFEVVDLFRQSMPIRFHDLEDTGGVAFAGRPLRSQNSRTANETTPGWSDCPRDLFAFMGVFLDEGVPCTVWDQDLLPVGGVQYGDDGQVMVGVKPSGEAWDYSCLATDGTGRFDVDVEFATSGGAFLMVGQADDDCTFGQGWAHSPWIIRP